MPLAHAAKKLPVLFLYNVEPDWSPLETEEALACNLRMVDALRRAGHPVRRAEVNHDALERLLDRRASAEHIVFNQCESLPGIPYSEHLVVTLLEQAGFAYTGSPPDTIRLAGDKAETKRLLEMHGIPSPAWQVFDDDASGDWNLFPAIVKTTREHCSLGLNAQSVVRDHRELQARIAYIRANFHQPALVEDFIDGREFHVALWGNGDPAVLPVVEMDFSAFGDLRDRLCTYDAKFIPDSRHYRAIESRIPASLTAGQRHRLEHICRETYRVFGCRDYARLDIRMRGDDFLVLDVNPNADLDSEASIAGAAEQSGIGYPELLSSLVRLAAERHPLYAAGA